MTTLYSGEPGDMTTLYPGEPGDMTTIYPGEGSDDLEKMYSTPELELDRYISETVRDYKIDLRISTVGKQIGIIRNRHF